jgi:hypothetical protein
VTSTGIFDFAARWPLLHDRRIGDHVVEGQRTGRLLLQARDFDLQRGELERVADRDHDPLGARGLHEEIRRARLHGLHHCIDAARGGEHDAWQRRATQADFLQRLVAVEARHDEIEQDEIDCRVFLHERDCAATVLGRHRLQSVALDGGLQHAALRRIVIDDQDGLGHVVHHVPVGRL